MFKANKWLTDGLPFVVYRFPQENLWRGVFQKDASLYKTEDFKSSGFVFAPFVMNGNAVFLKGEYLKEVMGNYEVQGQGQNIGANLLDNGKDVHLKLVRNAISEIERDTIKKVVLSRCISTSTTQKPDQIFISLLTKYPSAFCYWWYHPKIGMWFGATPEQLLQYQDGEVFSTSLAGTLPVKNSEDPSWTSKEMEEQQMVTDYIAQCLSGMVKELQVSPAKTQKAGRLWHLKSTIKGKLASLDDLEAIIRALHPTPAVCGLPKKASLDYIIAHEGYDREFYTGYLGPINVDNNEQVNLFVNLRCLKYSSGNAKVFVGGGITSESNPESEWKETQYKSRTMLEVL